MQYTNKENENLPGIFMQELKSILKEKQLEVPFLGINRRGVTPTIKRISKLLDMDE